MNEQKINSYSTNNEKDWKKKKALSGLKQYNNIRKDTMN